MCDGDDAVAEPVWKPEASDASQTRTRTFGTLDCGYETMADAWQQMDYKFAVGGQGPSRASHCYPEPRYALNLLTSHPVDVLVADKGSATPPRRKGPAGPDRWELLVLNTPPEKRPSVVLESWPASSATWADNPMSKGRRIRWEELGYTSRYKLLSSTAYGGAIRQQRLIVARVTVGGDTSWVWPTADEPQTARPMSNLLTPTGLLPRHARKTTTSSRTKSQAPDALLEPMPNCLGSWIRTGPNTVRRLQGDELYRGLGGNNQHLKGIQTPTSRGLLQTTSLFIWEGLTETIAGVPPNRPVDLPLRTNWQQVADNLFIDPPTKTVDKQSTTLTFVWAPPDLTPGKEWYNLRLRNLQAAAKFYPGREDELVTKGIAALAGHRRNYDATGAALKTLQLLWWEFPPEHWDPLREGSRAGFLTEPPACIHDNSAMTPEQLLVAAEFTDELIDIRAIGRATEPIHCNTPLFCIEKDGQVDQYRVIADCKAGGQNDHIGNDPVYLNRPLHILEQMYSGGFSAVVDASKFFYQFLLHPDDRKYMGLVHPVTGDHYTWHGCPMGSGSSPGLAGRYGLAFVRLLRERGPMFQQRARPNCWWSGFREEGYDPDLGYGFSFQQSDGSPAVKLFVHVDDFLIHGPTYESTARALSFFLDLTVDVGLLCHPKKLKPPSQQQRYTGFIFDTRREPTLRIPEDKLEKALAMVHHMESLPKDREMSRLALSVVAGTLESLADATPERLGHTYLRATHALIHPPGHEVGAAVYYTTATVPASVRQEMRWWRRILETSPARVLRSSASATLIPTWGDGSGTGTGGTAILPGEPMRMWMGQWTPSVFSHSSNWKELKTLLLTLQHLATEDSSRIRGTTVFYFTDNSTTYWIMAARSSRSPGLHSLIEQIQHLVLTMGCFLHVVHVPGTLMIEQGTDGLSRGIWASVLHERYRQEDLTRAVFAPVPVDWELVQEHVVSYQLSGSPVLHHWSQHWGSALFDHLSVWFPPPELARPCLIGILEAWIERPDTTSALLFIPRTLSGAWSALSRHIIELNIIYPLKTPMRRPPLLPIPVVVLYLPPHSRVLPPYRRMEPPPKVKNKRWHDDAANEMRRLSGTHPAH